MDTVYSIIFMILMMFAGLLFVGGVIFVIVKLVRNREASEKPFNITITHLFKVYLYIISFISLLIAVYGGSLAIKAGASYALGIPFSYDLYSASSMDVSNSDYQAEGCYNGKQISINNQEVCFNEDTRKQDLVNGITFFVSMIVIFALHQVALKRLERKSPTPVLKKLYTFLSLLLYSVIGIIIIPTAIYQVTTHFLYRVNDITSYTAPGTAVGVLLISVPLWVYFLLKTTQMKEEK